MLSFYVPIGAVGGGNARDNRKFLDDASDGELPMADILTAAIQRPRHIPSLDGLRALSVLLVITLHTLLRDALYKDIPFAYRLLGNGSLGVFIFFVISGYLITTLLLRERERTGRISLKSFYIRRGFRILPPLYLYVFFLVALGASGHLPGMNARELFTALTLTRNYSYHVNLWAMEHLWSLCIEEQFYLLWPTVLILCTWHRSGFNGRRNATRVALAILVAEPFLRVLCYRYLPAFHNLGMFHMQADGLMFGALGALQQGHPLFERIYIRATRWPWLLPLLIFVVLGALTVRFQNYWDLPLGITINGFCILMWLLWLVRNPASISGRIFNLPAIAWVGRLSYSLYIWQTFFLHHQSIQVFGRNGWWNTFPTSWMCILAVAVFSYYCVERPSLRLRDVVLRRMNWHET
jgi:peptidoglycan/LPS O-acetylase OafA/YrhL